MDLPRHASPPPPGELDQGHRSGGPTWVSRLTLGQVALIVALILLFWALSGVILLIFAAVLGAAALRGAADWVTARTKLPIGFSLAMVVLVIAGLLIGLVWWTGPILYNQLSDLAVRLIQELGRLQDHFHIDALLGDSGVQLQSLADRFAGPAASIFTFSLSTLTELVVAFVAALYFASAPDLYVGGVIRLAPIHYRKRLGHVGQTVAHVLRLWVLGQLIDMVVIGIVASFGLWMVGVPVPFALGAISGLFTFVPYLGTILSGALAILVALSTGVSTALWALSVFTLCHVVEGYLVGPIIQRRILELPPALTLLSMSVLGSLFGVLGIILGTPLAAVLLVLVQALYVGDVLGDHETDPTQHV